MDADTLAGLKRRLESERGDLRLQLKDMGVDPDTGSPDAVVFDEGFADSGQATAEKARVLSLAEGLHDMLVEVDAALERIASGGYGTCAACDQEIPAERLEARPASSRCVACTQRG